MIHPEIHRKREAMRPENGSTVPVPTAQSLLNMPGASRTFPHFLSPLVVALGLFGCSASTAPKAAPTPATTVAPAAPVSRAPASLSLPKPDATVAVPAIPSAATYPVMLGIDVLESQGFAALKGKRVGLITHPAGVNRRGVRTIEVLRRAPGVKLVALYSVEHGVNNEFKAGENYADYIDKRTGLQVYSLYSGRYKNHKPQPYQLKPIDVLVVDLQDIGSRSYTFTGAMREAMEACFENNVEVVVLDRPNPLGGLKVDGPLIDRPLRSYVGSFPVPYVHGLTMGELAKMAKEAPGVLDVPDAVRQRGKLTVVPMRGWTRAMRWTETGLPWVPTSPHMQDYQAVQGYPMTGLGCEIGGFSHGIGDQYDFRGLSHAKVKLDVVEKELRALKLPGLQFRRVSSPNARTGQPGIGIYVEISDWDEWHPTELAFHLMKLACKLEPKNPFAAATAKERSSFLRYMGSQAFMDDLIVKGARIDLDAWIREWQAQAKIYQQQSRKYWLYY